MVKLSETMLLLQKNYLNEEELYSLRRIVSAYLDLAESRAISMDKAITEFEKYRIIQDKLYEPDFDKYLIELEKVERSDENEQ